jgi:cytidylate kinase
MAVITLARQVGSGGQVVAAALAERFSFEIFGRKELRAEANLRGLSLPSSFERFASDDSSDARLNHYLSYGELEFDVALRGGSYSADGSVNSPFLTDMTSNQREILMTLQTLVYEIASRDNVVLVGAGAQILLSNFPWALRVKVIAPVETRTNRMIDTYHLSPHEADSAVRQGDQEQIDYNRVIFGEDWRTAELWDLVINSDRLSVEQIVALCAIRIAGNPPIPGEDARSLSAAATINRTILDASESDWRHISAAPTPAGITLSGEVATNESHARLMGLIATSIGQVNLVDELRELTPS